MLISMRDKYKKLLVKDILDIDFDMSIEEENKKFYVIIDSNYKLDEEFSSEADAEARMISIANIRNHLEEELRNY